MKIKFNYKNVKKLFFKNLFVLGFDSKLCFEIWSTNLKSEVKLVSVYIKDANRE